jgi:hypothetical protein
LKKTTGKFVSSMAGEKSNLLMFSKEKHVSKSDLNLFQR